MSTRISRETIHRPPMGAIEWRQRGSNFSSIYHESLRQCHIRTATANSLSRLFVQIRFVVCRVVHATSNGSGDSLQSASIQTVIQTDCQKEAQTVGGDREANSIDVPRGDDTNIFNDASSSKDAIVLSSTRGMYWSFGYASFIGGVSTS